MKQAPFCFRLYSILPTQSKLKTDVLYLCNGMMMPVAESNGACFTLCPRTILTEFASCHSRLETPFNFSTSRFSLTSVMFTMTRTTIIPVFLKTKWPPYYGTIGESHIITLLYLKGSLNILKRLSDDTPRLSILLHKNTAVNDSWSCLYCEVCPTVWATDPITQVYILEPYG